MHLLLDCVSPCASLVRCENQQPFNVFCAEPTAPIKLEPKIETVKIHSVSPTSNSSFTSACLVASASCPNQVMHLSSPAEFQSEDTQVLAASTEMTVRKPENACLTVESENEFSAVEPEDEFSKVDTEDVTPDQLDCDFNATESDNRDVLALPPVSLKNNGSIDGDSNSEYYNCVSDTASTTSSNRLNVSVLRPQENPAQPQPDTKLQWEMPDDYSNNPASPVRTEEVSHALVTFFPYFKSVLYFEIKCAKYKKSNQMESLVNLFLQIYKFNSNISPLDEISLHKLYCYIIYRM